MGLHPLSAGLEAADSALTVKAAKRSRRSWSAEEKRRIVMEASCPGASVADVARRHGVNANLVFSWCRKVSAPSVIVDSVAASAGRPESDGVPMSAAPDFIPIGVFARAPDGEPGLRTEPTPVAIAGPLPPVASPRSPVEARPGVIEVDLADGTRLRVDAFVNERALQRVLSALKATS